jgi:hypothetical protein
MLSCEDSTRLMSEGLDERLSPWQRFGLRFHVMMCGACRRYGRQIKGIEHLLRTRQATPTDAQARSLRLSAARREEIKRSLRS